MLSPLKRCFTAEKLNYHLRVFVFFLYSALALALADAPAHIYTAKGENAVLNPNYAATFINSIYWYHGSDMAAECFGGNVTCFSHFKGRCSLNFSTGALTIRGADERINGLYSVEINDNKIDSKIQLSVISKVSEPSILEECNTDKTSCNLTCDGNTTDAEPVSYKWVTEGIEIGSDKKLKITKDNESESFTCMIQNPVSKQSSENFKNPIITEGNSGWAFIFVPIGIAGVGLILVLIYRLRNGPWPDLNCIRRRAGAEAEAKAEEEAEENMQMLPNGGAGQNQVNANGLEEVQVELNQNPAPAQAQDNVGESENLQMLPNGGAGQDQVNAHGLEEVQVELNQIPAPAPAQDNVGESGSEAQRVTTEAQVSAEPQNGEEAPVTAGPSEQNPESSESPGTSQENESTSRTCETPVEDPQTLPEPVTNKDAVENSAVSLNNREPTNHKLTEHELNNHESNNHEPTNHKPTNHVPTLIEEEANVGGDGD